MTISVEMLARLLATLDSVSNIFVKLLSEEEKQELQRLQNDLGQYHLSDTLKIDVVK
jgi:hypothetical protein